MKTQIIPDVSALIDKAGGVMRLAAIAQVSRTSVIGWRTQGFIPGNRVAQISAALKLPTEAVLRLVQPPKPRERQTASDEAPKPKGKRRAQTPEPTPPHEDAA